jgi:hypothetical protein
MGADGPKVKCEDCGLVHGPALWTREQAQLLETFDIRVIMDTAERQEALRNYVPFSGQPEPDMEQAVASGE